MNTALEAARPDVVKWQTELHVADNADLLLQRLVEAVTKSSSATFYGPGAGWLPCRRICSGSLL